MDASHVDDPSSDADTDANIDDFPGKDVSDPANHDLQTLGLVPSPSQMPLPSFLSSQIVGRDIPGDVATVEGRTIDYSPTSPADSPVRPAARTLDSPSQSDRSDASIPEKAGESTLPPPAPSTSAPRDKVGAPRTQPPEKSN